MSKGFSKGLLFPCGDKKVRTEVVVYQVSYWRNLAEKIPELLELYHFALLTQNSINEEMFVMERLTMPWLSRKNGQHVLL